MSQDDLRKKLHADLDAYLNLLRAQRAEGELRLGIHLRAGELARWLAVPPNPSGRARRHRHKKTLTTG